MMKKYLVLLCLLTLSVGASRAIAQYSTKWQPRLGLTGSAGVWSPGGSDEDLFQASMGGAFSVLYWYRFRNQIQLRASYTPLNTRQEIWGEPYDTGEGFDVWNVKGSLWVISLEWRRLFPTDRKNFMYFGVGADYYQFGKVEGTYEIYGGGAPVIGTTSDERNPSVAGGAHLAPGMFFIFHKRIYIDVSIRVHFMIDGADNPYWLEPCFSMSFRLF